jgi:hypothetical protein
VNVGSVNTRIGALAKVQYYNHRAKKQQEERTKQTVKNLRAIFDIF